MVAMLFATGNTLHAQEKQRVRTAALQQTSSTVYLTITSPKEFYIGNNKYVLHIGTQTFDLYDQSNTDEGVGILKFHIPAKDFNALPDGEKIYLTYGEMDDSSGESLEDLSTHDDVRCWYAGKLTKKHLR